MTRMRGIKARVRNGYFVSDEPADLPEGTGASIVLEDPFAGMTPDERAELEAAIEEGYTDFSRGDFADARECLAQLRSRRS